MSSDTCRCGSGWKQADIALASQAGSLLGQGQQVGKGAWSKGNAREVLFGDFPPVGDAMRKGRRANGNGKAEEDTQDTEPTVTALDQAQSIAAFKSALEQAQKLGLVEYEGIRWIEPVLVEPPQHCSLELHGNAKKTNIKALQRWKKAGGRMEEAKTWLENLRIKLRRSQEAFTILQEKKTKAQLELKKAFAQVEEATKKQQREPDEKTEEAADAEPARKRGAEDGCTRP